MFANSFANILRSTFALAIAASATLIVVAGSAAPVAAAEAVTVNVNAYNLASPTGRAAAEAAVRNAADSVCATGTPEQLASARATRSCTAKALTAARPQIDAIAASQTARNTVASLGTGSTGR